MASAGGEPELLLDAPGAARAPAWSPDGTRVAYSGTSGGATSIWILRVGTLETERVTRSPEEDLRPDWSPDGRRLAFTRSDRGRSRIWVIRVRGGTARPVDGHRRETSTRTGRSRRRRSRPARGSSCPTSTSVRRPTSS